MKPKDALIPFIQLLFSDKKQLLKSLLNYTKEAHKRRYFKRKYGKKGLPFADIGQFARIDEKIDNYTYLDGTSRPIDIAFLMAVAKNYTDCNYLEIGSWRGESLFNVSTVSQRCTSISLSKEEMIRIGMSEKAAELQRFFSKGKNNIEHIEANSLQYDFENLKEKFDVIFIDGDHSYKGVKSDTENAFKLLRNEDSVIVWHDFGGFEG